MKPCFLQTVLAFCMFVSLIHSFADYRNRPYYFVSTYLGKFWNSVKRTATQISHSVVEARQREKEEADTVTALASLSMRTVECATQDSEK